MKQLTDLCTVIWLVIMLNMFPMQAMENNQPLIVGDIASDLLILPDEISAQIASLYGSISAYLTLKNSCKEYNDLLTCEVIGNHCRRYPQDEKDEYLSYKIADMSDSITPRDRLIVSTLICAGAYLADRYKVLELAVKHGDTELAEMVFNHPGVLDLNGSVRISDDSAYFFSYDLQAIYGRMPLFFMIKSIDMVKLFIAYGADIHETMGDDTNVLWYILQNDYPSELMNFYLTSGVDAALVNSYAKGRSILHKLALTYYSGGTHARDNFITKAKLLLDAIPGNINRVDFNDKTPTDAAYESLKYAKKISKLDGDKSAVVAYQALVVLFQGHGGLTGEKLEQQIKKLSVKEPKSKKKQNSYHKVTIV